MLACGKDLRLLVAQPSTEEYVNSGGVELLQMFIQFIFVLELRRCVGIRMCNSNTPMDTSLFLIASPCILRVDEYIANYICTIANVFI